MIVNGIECELVNNKAGQKIAASKPLYAQVPLEWLHNLPGESTKVKLIVILWCYSGMEKGGWFPLGNRTCRQYGISPSQKSRILVSLQESGHVELHNEPGKAVRVKVVKPTGWR